MYEMMMFKRVSAMLKHRRFFFNMDMLLWNSGNYM
jgi:hypothetical protein